MEPTVSTVITWVAGGLVTGLVTYLFLRMAKIEDRHEALGVKFQEHLAALPDKYVSKDDYRADVQEIKDTLREMRADMKQMLSH